MADLVINIDFQTHLPGYVKKADELKKKGISDIFCISVNDPFVMAAWGKEHNAAGKVCSFNYEIYQRNLFEKLNFLYLIDDYCINLNLFPFL